MSAKPINSTNAIDAVAFVVLFNRPFTEKEDGDLLQLKEMFKDELPNFSKNTIVTLKQESGRQPEHVVKESGLKLQKFEPNGKIGWILNITDGQLIITCQSYDRWDKVWAQTDKYIKATLKLLNLASLSVQACVLQYIDRFFTEESTKYNIYEVFDENTKYLTKKSIEVEKLWHVHQGWFDKKSENEKILNILNLGTSEDNNNIITTIDHSLQLQFISNPKPANKFFDDKKEYEKVFSFLHEKNKDIIKSLINQEQRKAVGLEL
jgi:uncharacterized protein (TIGR04255 family)